MHGAQQKEVLYAENSPEQTLIESVSKTTFHCVALRSSYTRFIQNGDSSTLWAGSVPVDAENEEQWLSTAQQRKPIEAPESLPAVRCFIAKRLPRAIPLRRLRSEIKSGPFITVQHPHLSASCSAATGKVRYALSP
ncbi:hypothetical protein TNCV_4101751 [Trichonephila clavipes]|nr:hypothetical protein TNCV_4101751 [Trichonephila clavipes]